LGVGLLLVLSMPFCLAFCIRALSKSRSEETQVKNRDLQGK
jgi:hypothetical protein